MRWSAPQRLRSFEAGSLEKASKISTNAQIEISTHTTLVVVADNREATRAAAVEELEGWGFNVLAVEDAKACIDLLELGILPHILLMALPGAEGEESAERFARAVPGLEVVLAGTPEEITAHNKRGGWRASAFVRSPYTSFEELRAAFAGAFERVQLKLYTRFLANEIDALQRRLEIETRIAMEVSEAPDAEIAMAKGLEGLSEIFEGPAVFFRWFPEQNSLQAESRFPSSLFAGAHPRLMVARAGRAALEDLENDEGFKAMLVQASQMDGAHKIENKWKTSIVEIHGQARGAIAVAPAQWSETPDRPSLSRCVRTLSVGWDAADARAQATDAAIRDTQTKLLTYRHFNERLSEEIQRARRLWHPVSLLTLEAVSDVKASSDESEEASLVRVVRQVSKILKASFRATDLVTSLGGRRFAVALPHTSFADALIKADRLRVQVAEESEGSLRIAVGAAEYPGHVGDHVGLVRAAEQACAEALAHGARAVSLAAVPEGFVPPFVPGAVRVQAPIVKNPA